MTLKQLLDSEILGDLTVINEAADLEREVATVEQTEAPDVVSYVSENSFIITTAMVYKDDQEKLCELILQLNAMPGAGLGIKLGRFVDELDSKVIATADSVKFPLIRIPMKRTLGDVYHDILSLIWDTENKELIHVLNTRKKFYDLIIRGIELKRLLGMLGAMINKRILIVDRFGEICEKCNTTKQEEQAAIELIRKIDMDNIENEKLSFLSCEGAVKIQVLVYPIKSINRKTHFLLVFESENNTAISAFVMEEISLILGMHFYKELFVHYNEMQYKERFIKFLLEVDNDETLSSRQILTLGKEYGLKQSTSYKVMVCGFRYIETQKFNTAHLMRKEERYILLFHYLIRKMTDWFQNNILVFPDFDNWRYIFLLQERDMYLDDRLMEISAAVESAFGKSLMFAYGNDVRDVRNIVDSYWNAMEVLKHLPADTEEIIFIYHPSNIMELLKRIPENQMKEVCKNMLRELAFPEDEMHLDLKKTLKMYLDCHCSIMETANRLYLHRNTVRYRIKKCEEILKRELSDSEYCFQLQLCLILSDMH